jgi:CheY-like chemotaxis protein
MPTPTVRILVVDDEEVILELLRDILEPEGYEVLTVSNGREALRLIEAVEFDLLISDFQMPEMDGAELYRKACEIRPELADRFVFTSGAVTPDKKRRFLAAIGAWILSKPFRVQEVRHLVRNRLASLGPRDRGSDEPE